MSLRDRLTWWTLACSISGLLGGALGVANGLLAGPMAGESTSQRLVGVLAVDYGILLLVGAGVGVVLGLMASRLPSPSRNWARFGVVGTLVHMLACIALVEGQFAANAPVLVGELMKARVLEQPLPTLGSTNRSPRAVVLISLDTVRADALGSELMPRVSRRAEAGLRYTRAHSNSSWTLPSMASLHTGQSPSEHGAHREGGRAGNIGRAGLTTSQATLAEALADQGFVNAAVVTNPLNGMRYDFHRGFDRFHDLSRGSLRREALRRAVTLAPFVTPMTDRGSGVTDTALELARAGKDGDLFLWAHYLDAHTPYSSEPDTFDPLGDCELPECFHGWSQVRRGSRTLDGGEKTRIRELYDSDLAYLDQEVDRLLGGLEDLGMLDHTLVLLVADHGEEFWEHGGFEHGMNFHEASTVIPMVAWVPGRTGAEVTHGVDLTSVYSAVLSWTGGGGLGPLEPGAPNQISELSSLLFGNTVGACTDGQSKVMDVDGQTLSFDLVSDPLEQRGSRARPGALLDCHSAIQSTVPGGHQGGDPAALRALGYMD